MNTLGYFVPISDGKTAIYIVLVFLLALGLSKKSDNFWLTFFLVFWILGQPVVNAFYIISPKWLPFDLQPNRILLIIMFFFLGLYWLKKPIINNSNKKHKPRFLIYLIVYIIMVIVSMWVNRQQIEVKRLVAIPLDPVTFLVLFQVVRFYVTKDIIKRILYSIVIMSLINSFVAIYQVMIDPVFFRTGVPRLAYGNIYRAYGLFPTEYILGGFQIISLFVVFVLFKNNIWRYIFTAILVCSVFVTFHRLDMIILLLCVILYFKKYSEKKVGIGMLILLAMAAIAIVPSYIVIKSISGESKLVKERLSDDTVSGRFKQFSVVLEKIPQYPLGLGSYDHPDYQRLMIKHKMTKSVVDSDGVQKAVGLGVHNGFLGAGIQYGIVAMVVLFMLLWKMNIYFYKRASRKQPITIIPLYASLVWLLSNLSNGIIRFDSYNVLITAILCGAFSGIYEKGFLNKISTD